MSGTDYRCAVCGGVFTRGRDDDSAMQEAIERFGPEVLEQDLAIICDDCDKKVTAWLIARNDPRLKRQT